MEATGLTVKSRVTLYPGRHELEAITWPEAAKPELAEVVVFIDAGWAADLDESVVGMLVTLDRSPLDAASSSDWSWSTTAVVIRRDGAVIPKSDLEAVDRGWRLPTEPIYSSSVRLDASFTYRIKMLQVLIASEEDSPTIARTMPLRTYAAPPPKNPKRAPNPDVRRQRFYDSLDPIARHVGRHRHHVAGRVA